MRRMGGDMVISGQRANGEEFPIDASISHAIVAGRKLYTVILRDVTERQRALEEQRHAGRADRGQREAPELDHRLGDGRHHHDRRAAEHRALQRSGGKHLPLRSGGRDRREHRAFHTRSAFARSHRDHVSALRRGRRDDAAHGRRARARGAARGRRGIPDRRVDLACRRRTAASSTPSSCATSPSDTARPPRSNKSHQELRELYESMHQVREAERTRIARELHDELAQWLTALKMDVVVDRDAAAPRARGADRQGRAHEIGGRQHGRGGAAHRGRPAAGHAGRPGPRRRRWRTCSAISPNAPAST